MVLRRACKERFLGGASALSTGLTTVWSLEHSALKCIKFFNLMCRFLSVCTLPVIRTDERCAHETGA